MRTTTAVAVGVVVRPAGMTYERAMSIAMSIDARAHGILVTPEEAAERWPIKRQVQSVPSTKDPNAEADAALEQLCNDGLNDKEIAERLGIPRNTVGQRRRALGIPPQAYTRNHNRELHEALLESYRAGRTDRQTSELLGIPRQRIAQARIRYGIPCNYAPQ